MGYIIDIHQHPYPGVHEFMEQQHIKVTVLLPGPGDNDRVLAGPPVPGPVRAVLVGGPGRSGYGFEDKPSLVILDGDFDREVKKRILWQNARDLLNLPESTWAAEGM